MTLWTIFIRWIYAGFLNLIYELYWRIQFKNRVQNRADLWFCELYLFDEYLPVFWTSFLNFIVEVYKYNSQITFKKPTDSWLYWQTQFKNKVQNTADFWLCELYLFDEYMPVFWTLFMNLIGEYSSKIKFRIRQICDFVNYIRWISASFWTLFTNCHK